MSSSCQGDLKIASAARERGQGENEEKWPFAGKLPAMNPAWTWSGVGGSLVFTMFFVVRTTFLPGVCCGRTQLPVEKALFAPWTSSQEDVAVSTGAEETLRP